MGIKCERKVTKYELYHRTIKGGWEKEGERINEKKFGVNLNKKFKGKKIYKIREKEICVK